MFRLVSFFCIACREELSTKLGDLRSHLRSKKHAAAMKEHDQMEAHECNIAQVQVVHDKTHPCGATIPTLQGKGTL